MILIPVPILPVHSVLIPVQVELIHPKYHRNVLRLPQFLVGILIAHAQGLHHVSAVRIFYIVGGGDIGHAVSPQLFQYGSVTALAASLTIPWRQNSFNSP